jgi:hypothetical protein
LPVADSGYSYGMLVTSKLEGGRWTPPTPASFSLPRQGDDVPFFAPDGAKLFFLSSRPDAEGHSGGERIWWMDRTEQGWSEPRLIDGGPNTKEMHWQFSVAANGSIYFNSGDPGGHGRGDIYVSRLVEGRYATPENLGGVVNSEYDEEQPFIAPDESYIIFGRYGTPDAIGGVDLYISFRDSEGRWTEPLNMGEPINSRSHEICPIVTHDGEYLFFNSFRSGNADNYCVSGGAP